MSAVAPAIRRSIGIGLLTLVVAGTAQLAYLLGFCRDHRAWVRAQTGVSTVILAGGVKVARSGDAIFACETTHRLGPFALHQDLKCYCAPRSVSADTLANFLAGSCVVDKLDPQRTDAFGACQFARCSDHLDP